MEKNWSYTVTEGKHKGETIWSGRYCCVVGFVFTYIFGKWSVLANLRGKGAADNQGLWNAPCGFLEADESGEEGISRETFEETTIKVDPKEFTFKGVQTSPVVDPHVTLKYVAIIDSVSEDASIYEEGLNRVEKDEVEKARWIPLDEVDNLNWAFGHRELIKVMWDAVPADEKLKVKFGYALRNWKI